MTIPFDATGRSWRDPAPHERGTGEARLQTKFPDRYHQERSLTSDERSMTTDSRVKAELARQEPLRPDATIELLDRVKRGDDAALEVLLGRCIPALRRWAHGRLPPSSRGMMETADLVQDTVLAALRRLGVFEARHQGALQAYLRQAVMNRIRDVIRSHRRRPIETALPDHLVDAGTSPLEQAIGSENVERYEAAVQRLRPADREAIVGRLELQYSYDELAVLLNKPTGNAARVAVTRAMKRLVDEMRRAS
jgi:RNA polymerase sigma-70 factor (ECF subfamily)